MRNILRSGIKFLAKVKEEIMMKSETIQKLSKFKADTSEDILLNQIYK